MSQITTHSKLLKTIQNLLKTYSKPLFFFISFINLSINTFDNDFNIKSIKAQSLISIIFLMVLIIEK